MRIVLLVLTALMITPANAQVSGSPLIDYDGFQDLTSEVRPFRSKRLITLADFNKRAGKHGVLVLDARSAQAFKEGHIKGAVNLPLPDFTAESLREIIGKNPGREILIYCNNNFTNNRRPVMTKSLPLALNIQTFINLYGYGYRNVWELGEAVDMDTPQVRWVSAAAT
jgi:phage shock protein E